MRGRRDSEGPRVGLHKKPLSRFNPSAVPPKTRQIHSTTLSPKSALARPADSSHGVPDYRQRAPAFLPPRKPPRSAHAKRPQIEVVCPHRVAVRRTYLYRERPPYCVGAITTAQIRRRTRTSLVRPPSVFGHLAPAKPLISTCKVWKRLLLVCTGGFSYVARASSGA